jgi:hypothetical protein
MRRSHESILNMIPHEPRIWYTYFADDFGECYICKKAVLYYEWKCGFICHPRFGGQVTPQNCKVLCSSCADNQGTKPLEEVQIIKDLHLAALACLKSLSVKVQNNSIDEWLQVLTQDYVMAVADSHWIDGRDLTPKLLIDKILSRTSFVLS